MLFKRIMFIFLLIAFTDSVSVTADPSKEKTTLNINPSSSCPQLFGNGTSHQANKSQRNTKLRSVREKEETIWLTHHVDWQEPDPIRYRGLELVNIQEENHKNVAVFRIKKNLSGFGCDLGLYRIRADDSIGTNDRILAILSNAVLIEHNEKLYYLKVEGTKTPVFRMVWAAKWKMPILPESRSSGRMVTPKRPRKPKHKPKHRGRRR